MDLRLRRSASSSRGFGRAAAVLLVGALFVTAWSLYFAGDWRNVDVDFYHVYALGFWGNPSHRLLPTEYPPLSILPFSVTLLGPVTVFPVTFALFMAGVAAIGFVAFLRQTSLRQAGAYAIFVLAAGVGTVFYRYDLVPALLACGAIWFLYKRWFGVVYPLLAIATLVKLFPIVLLPIAIIEHWRARRAGASGITWLGPLTAGALCLALVAVGFGVASIIDGPHALTSLTYDFQRPDEVESVPATILWLASLVGVSARPDASFGSLNLLSTRSSAINALAGAALIGGLLFVYARQLRGRSSPGQAAIGAILVLLATSKVLSAQYFIWLAPLLALSLGFELRWLLLFLLTGLIFPTLWEVAIIRTTVPTYTTVFLIAIALRNALLAGLTIGYLRQPSADIEARRGKDVLVVAPPTPQSA